MKINSKWTNDFNLESETLKPLMENITDKLHDVGQARHFWSGLQQHRCHSFSKLGHMTFSLYTVKEAKLNKRRTGWEKTLPSMLQTGRLISRVYKEQQT